MCSCTLTRSSVIIRCEDFESSCARQYDVSAWINVAPSTTSTSGSRSFVWCFVTTSSIKYFGVIGRAKPHKRLTAISRKPASSTPRRGLISSQTCGSNFQKDCLAGLGCPTVEERVGRSPFKFAGPEGPDVNGGIRDSFARAEFARTAPIIAEAKFGRDDCRE